MRPGWLKRQLDKARDDVSKWPKWLRQEAGLEPKVGRKGATPMTQENSEQAVTVPEIRWCTKADPHPAHDYESYTHKWPWRCPGVPAAAAPAGGWQLVSQHGTETGLVYVAPDESSVTIKFGGVYHTPHLEGPAAKFVLWQARQIVAEREARERAERTREEAEASRDNWFEQYHNAMLKVDAAERELAALRAKAALATWMYGRDSVPALGYEGMVRVLAEFDALYDALTTSESPPEGGE